MYHVIVNLNNDEIIRFETSDVTIEYNKKRIKIAIMITNKRIIFLQDINKNTLIEAFHITRGCYTLPTFQPIEEILKKEIRDYSYIGNGTEILTDDNNIFVFNYDLTEALKE